MFSINSMICQCEKLTDLKFDDMFPIEIYPSPSIVLLPNFMSSTLIKLEVNVGFFSDCLRLLEGRLDSLSTLIIKVLQNVHPFEGIDTTVSILLQ